MVVAKKMMTVHEATHGNAGHGRRRGARGGAGSPEEDRGGRGWLRRGRIWAERRRRRGPRSTATSLSSHGRRLVHRDLAAEAGG